MRITGLFIILLLLLAVLSPLSINVSPLAKGSYIVTFDVCHASGSSVLIDSDMPVIDERAFIVTALEFAGFIESVDQRPGSNIIFFQFDRPPRSQQ